MEIKYFEKMKDSNLYSYIELMKTLSPVTLDMISARSESELELAMSGWITKSAADIQSTHSDLLHLDNDRLAYLFSSSMTNSEIAVIPDMITEDQIQFTVKLINHSIKKGIIKEFHLSNGKRLVLELKGGG